MKGYKISVGFLHIISKKTSSRIRVRVRELGKIVLTMFLIDRDTAYNSMDLNERKVP